MAPQRTAGRLSSPEHDLPRPRARFDLVFEFVPRDGGLVMALEYNTDLFDASTIYRIAGTSGAAWTASPRSGPQRSAAAVADRPPSADGCCRVAGPGDRRAAMTAAGAVRAAGRGTPRRAAVVCEGRAADLP